MFFYDVPDAELVTNMWVSWALTIAGVSGIIVSLLWKKRNPMIDDDTSQSTDNNDDENRGI